VSTALIATGLNFPDALAGGPAAYANKLPLLLVNDTVPAATKSAISSLGIKKAVVLGGTAAISPAVETELASLTGNPVQRLAGTDRYGTAQAVGDWEISTLSFPATSALLATGEKFPDALTGGPLGGQLKAPIVLVQLNALPAPSQAFLDAHSNTIAKLYVLGGTAAISDAVVASAVTAAQTTGNDSGGTSTSTLPELQSASIQSTTGTGTTIRYCFDESVTGNAAGDFHAITAGDDRYDGANVATVAGDAKCVDVKFTDAALQTAAGAATLTVATVDASAVTDNDAVPSDNPIGDTPLGTQGSATLVAGKTAAPDLQSVGGFASDPFAPADTLVNFTFDQVAYDDGGGYNIVKTDGTLLNGVYEDGTGTTTIQVRFAGQTLTSSNVARGYVDAGAVDTKADLTGIENPIQAADVAGPSTGPDLTSATLQLDAVAGSTKVDRVIYNFDADLLTAPTAANFQAYLADGSEVGGALTATRNDTNQKQVAVDFTDGTLATAVGASVDAAAVVQFGGATPANQVDEEGLTNAGTVTTTPGKTDDPDLLLATVAAVKDAFGNVTGAVIALTFDENLELGDFTNEFAWNAYEADGTSHLCTSDVDVSATAPSRQDTVVCSSLDGGAITPALAKRLVLVTVDNDSVQADDSVAMANPEGASPTLLFGF